MKKRAQTFFIVTAIILVAFFLFKVVFSPGGLSTIGSAGICMEPTSVPNSPKCITNDDCIKALIPQGQVLDNGVSLKCNAGVCQMSATSCSGEVNP